MIKLDMYVGIYIGTLLVVIGYVGVLVGINVRDVPAGPVVVLPNDVGLVSKYEGDPSLLSAYVRNDSIILNFEGY